MKKLSSVLAILLVIVSLSACGSHSNNKHTSSTKSHQVVRHHSKKSKQAQKTSSSSSSEPSYSSSSQTQPLPSVNDNQQKSASNGQLPPASDLHDFVNRYGESPAAYLSQHYGMSAEQALQSVPNNMKTSGEIQDTIMLQKGQDPFK